MEIYRYGTDGLEHLIYPISESGHEPFGNERGRFQARDVITKYDRSLDMHPVYQREDIKWFYFDTSGNVYPSKLSNQILFNLLK